MVKGVARHAVIVKSPDMKDFEQAIFIMSGESENPHVRNPSEMLKLACNLASGYVPKSRATGGFKAFGYILSFLCGCAATAGAWWALIVFGIL